MSNTKRPVIEWLRTIADPIVRESAIAQCVQHNEIVINLPRAIENFAVWHETKEGHNHWMKIFDMAMDGKLITINQLATISPAETNWMDEVHTMD